jgi:hypothetical protein
MILKARPYIKMLHIIKLSQNFTYHFLPINNALIEFIINGEI